MELRSDVTMIMAGKNNYVRDSYENIGVRTLRPYKDKNLATRIIRELWFRSHLPYKDFWFNNEIKEIITPKIYIRDPLIVGEFVEWVCKNHPSKKIAVIYSNRLNRATIQPKEVDRPNLVYVSYDEEDCKNNDMVFSPARFNPMYSSYFEKKTKIDYDVVYLGRDKGRADDLLRIQKKMENMGLRTYFHICADRAFMRYKHRYYKPTMKYEEYIELLTKTKAHLNLVPKGQKSITQRELESAFYQVKCITNNIGILNFELYDRSRYFVIGKDDLDDLPDFLESEFKLVDKSSLRKFLDDCNYV